eukprot:1185224-Prorocentrum_minimum.AAC.1
MCLFRIRSALTPTCCRFSSLGRKQLGSSTARGDGEEAGSRAAGSPLAQVGRTGAPQIVSDSAKVVAIADRDDLLELYRTIA